MNKFTIVKDTREKRGWYFRASDSCEKMIVEKLDTGDYTLAGMQDFFVIERKGSVVEFVGNLFEKRFYNELERMEAITHPFLFLEFPPSKLTTWPYYCGLGRQQVAQIKTTSKLIMKKFFEIQTQFKTKILFVDVHGQAYALSLMKRINELWHQNHS